MTMYSKIMFISGNPNIFAVLFHTLYDSCLLVMFYGPKDAIHFYMGYNLLHF